VAKEEARKTAHRLVREMDGVKRDSSWSRWAASRIGRPVVSSS